MTAAQRAAFKRVFGHECPLDEERDWLRDYGCFRRGVTQGLSAFSLELFRLWGSK